MNISILASFDSIPYFTIESIRQFLGGESTLAASVRTTLYRWMKAGHLIQLKKGVYMTQRFYEQHRAEADFSPAVSAILLPLSYVSLEFILQRYSILTEVTYPVSAVTIKNTHVIESQLGTFTYRHIKEKLYTGFRISDYFGLQVAQASLAKALFDYLYLRPLVVNIHSASYNLAEDLRLNLEDFSFRDQREFSEFVEISQSKKMEQILGNLRQTIWRP